MHKLFTVFFLSVLLTSCNEHKTHTHEENEVNSVTDNTANEKAFVALMQKHLNAVTNRDLKTLASTLSPNGEMQLILPGEDIMYTAEKFMEFHRGWFQDTLWTFETKILNTDVGERFGMAVTELTYREPERNGKPYFNRQIVSYDLKKINGEWYVVKDHCTSAEKTQ
jgi:hypothetical protein